MSSRIRPRARVHRDREGDPLDGLVNLFDLGVVLALAFLLAALASLDLTAVLTRGDVTVIRSGPDGETIVSRRGRNCSACGSRPASASRGRGSGSEASTGCRTPARLHRGALNVEFLWDGLEQAFELLLGGDEQVLEIIWITLRMAFWSTLLALALGVPADSCSGSAASAAAAPVSRSPTPGWACRRSSSGSWSRCSSSAARRSGA